MKLMLLALALATTTFAQTLVFNFDTLPNDAHPPANTPPWLVASFTDLGSNSVLFNLESNLYGSEFLSKLGLGFDVLLDSSQLTFSNVSTVGNFIVPTLGYDFSAGLGNKFDLVLNFRIAPPKSRFNGNDKLSFIFNYSGDEEFTSAAFNQRSPFVAMAHIQGICEEDSAWVTPSVIPEAQSAMLGLLGSLLLLKRRK
jgi:hypothetical protein